MVTDGGRCRDAPAATPPQKKGHPQHGVELDYVEARRWALAAAERGTASSMTRDLDSYEKRSAVPFHALPPLSSSRRMISQHFAANVTPSRRVKASLLKPDTCFICCNRGINYIMGITKDLTIQIRAVACLQWPSLDQFEWPSAIRTSFCA
jgi:hypothetical protein